MKNTGTQASPRANATGTRSSSSTKNAPNSISAACRLVMTAAPQADVLPDLLPEEQCIRCAGERPGDMDRQHVEPGQLGFLVVAEQRELVAEPDESERDQ